MFVYAVDRHTRLKLLDTRDAKPLFALVERNRNHLSPWLPWVDKTVSVKDMEKFIERTQQQWVRDNGFTAGIVYRGELVGVVGTYGIRWAHRKTEIGYWLDEKHMGKGIVSRSCAAVVDELLTGWKLNRITILCAVDNTASRAIPERLGFQREGIMRQAEKLRDGYADYVVYAMLRQDWQRPAWMEGK